MNFNIISMGKLKEDYLKAASAEYQKRIQAFGKINIVELVPARLPENPSPNQLEQALYDEAGQILRKIPQSGYIVALCPEGGRLTSERFANRLSELYVKGRNDFYFIIGSSYGLSEKVKRTADMTLSMSDMTFPHQLARIMLLEQLYRALTIQNNKKYNK